MDLVKRHQEITCLQSILIKEQKNIDIKLDKKIVQKCTFEKAKFAIENIKLNILLKHSKFGRKGNFPQWDSNPMPLICRMSALT